MKRFWPLLLLLLGAPLGAQLVPGLPQVGVPNVGLPRLPIDRTLDRVEQLTDRTAARVLERARLRRIASFLHDNRATVAPDDRGFPAVRGEVLLTAPEPGDLDALLAQGFTMLADETIPGLDLRTVRLGTPPDMSLEDALDEARDIADDRISADNIHFQSGVMRGSAAAAPPMAAAGSAGAGTRLGLIDGGVAASPIIPARVTQQGFARGAPAPDGHATAIASLLIGKGRVHGVAPGARLFAADVYGRDPAGGNALAIAKALGWMVENGVDVVTISLVGPSNGLLSKAVARAEAKGTAIVAAVGNDGPAAPPAYPASYPGVVSVTGVDRRNRALVEAGNARDLDYAAPGADMVAAAPGGGVVPVRGTSFAAPFVAGRLALLKAESADARVALDREARDLGPDGPDKTYGHGLVCGECATRR
jgi:hypothetical protein